MAITVENKSRIMQAINELPPDKMKQIIAFIDFLSLQWPHEKSGMDDSSLLLQQESLSTIWDDDEDLYAL